MKTFLLFTFLIYTGIIYAQYDYQCGMTPDYEETYPKGYQVNPPQIGGRNAPAKTLNGAYVRIFCVFAQFSADTKDPGDTNWPINQMPVWANSFIGTDKNQAPFPVNTISNYFYEMSNGQNIIIGYIHPELVIVNSLTNEPYGTSNSKVLQQIDATVNFQEFDQWRMLGDYQQTFDQTDNYVDAIYIIWRNMINPIYKWGGIAALGTNYTTNDGVIISNRIPTISMTLNIGNRSNYTFQNQLGLLAHEYGHYLYGAGHNFELAACSGTAQRGLGIMPAWAGSLAMNPQEKYLLGYTTYSDIFYDQTGLLSDFQSSGSSYRIPIPLFINGVPNYNPNEFFVIANHQKSTLYEQTRSTGVYIYHVKSNYYGHNHIDMIAADGLWQWSVINWVTPIGLGGPADWYCKNGTNAPPPTKLPMIKKLGVDRVNGRDELQEVVRAQYPESGPYYGQYYWWDKWYDEFGNRVESPIGDDEDAFNIGHNQLFSTFSNPPTFDKNRVPTNTAVELISNNNGVFNLQFYTDATSVLNASPSKPPLGWYHPGTGPIYQGWIYLGWGADLWDEYPIESDVNWSELQRKIGTGSWTTVYSGPNRYWSDGSITYDPNGNTPVYFRVRVRDSQNLWSVWSDIFDTKMIHHSVPIDKQTSNNQNTEILADYNLFQNYPNPFNPSTVINYTLKEAGYVSLKVYNTLGQEVSVLVDEVKEAGYHTAEFSARTEAWDLPSGVYIYSLQVNGYSSSRKMLSIK